MEEIEFEIKHLDNKKVGTLMNIPTKQLKQVIDIVADLLMEIWNVEIVQRKKYLKYLFKTCRYFSYLQEIREKFA